MHETKWKCVRWTEQPSVSLLSLIKMLMMLIVAKPHVEGEPYEGLDVKKKKRTQLLQTWHDERFRICSAAFWVNSEQLLPLLLFWPRVPWSDSATAFEITPSVTFAAMQRPRRCARMNRTGITQLTVLHCCLDNPEIQSMNATPPPLLLVTISEQRLNSVQPRAFSSQNSPHSHLSVPLPDESNNPKVIPPQFVFWALVFAGKGWKSLP